MALGRKNKNASGKLLVLKIVTQDADKKPVSPVFSIREKGTDGTYETRAKTETQVTGKLFKVELEEKEFKGDKYNTVALFLGDGEETYLIDTRVNSVTRGLYNSLLNLKRFDDVTISVGSYNKEINGENKTLNSASVFQDGKLVRWLYKDEVPKPKNLGQVRGKNVYDWSPVDNFFLGKLTEFAKTVEAANKNARKVNVPVEVKTAGPDEDVPF